MGYFGSGTDWVEGKESERVCAILEVGGNGPTGVFRGKTSEFNLVGASAIIIKSRCHWFRGSGISQWQSLVYNGNDRSKMEGERDRKRVMALETVILSRCCLHERTRLA